MPSIDSMRTISQIFIFIVGVFCATYSYGNINGRHNDFDEICRIYTEIQNSNMSLNTASNYLLKNIEKRVRSNDALVAHSAILEAMSDRRYELFKQSAEEVLGTVWRCPAMESLYHSP